MQTLPQFNSLQPTHLKPQIPPSHFPLSHPVAHSPIEQKKKQWSPYVFHGGSVLAISGKDFALIAADTRLSQGYSIISRNTSKLQPLTQKCILGTSGMYCQFEALKTNLHTKINQYQYLVGRKPSTVSIANLLSKTLYSRRFFPYYTFNVLIGLDQEGRGVCYGYDAVGSYSTQVHNEVGSGAIQISSFLDFALIGKYNPNKEKEITKQRAEEIAQCAFEGCAQRDIYTGDGLQILILTKQGIKKKIIQLRKD